MPRLAASFRRFRCDNDGAVVVLAAVLFPVVVGGMGLGAEVGYWYLTERKLQHAADVSAHAAAIRKRAGDDEGGVEAAALRIAAGSGFSAPIGSVLVNNPPASGGYEGDANSVEVLISERQPRLFSSIFTSEPLTLSARAVAQISGGGKACVLALSSTAPGAITVTGSASVGLIGCDMASNSTDASSFSMPNNGSSVSTGCVYSAGGANPAQPANLTLTECEAIRTKAPPIRDPYADVAEPSLVSGGCETSSTVGKQNESTTLTPTFNHASGMKSMRFCGGLTVRGDVKFEPGLYIIEGGDVVADFETGGKSSMAGEGVVFFLKNARFKLNSNLTSQFTAPTSGPYAGILIFGSRSDSSITHTINGGASSYWHGAIYAPASAIDIRGNASSEGGCTQLIGNTITLSGNSSLQHDCGEETKEIVTSQSVKIVE